MCFNSVNRDQILTAQQRRSNERIFNDKNEEHPLKVLYSNCDCLTQTKLSEIEQYVSEDSPDILVLTEIFPKHSVFELRVKLYNTENYDLFISTLVEGRGVAIYVKKKFVATQLIFDSKFKEHGWCKIKISGNNNLTRENTQQLMELIGQQQQIFPCTYYGRF